MSLVKFEYLVTLIAPHMTRKDGNGPNGKIPVELEISAALDYFAGASKYNLIISHGLSHTTLFVSVWRVVSATNKCIELKVIFPTNYEDQKRIASQFLIKSTAKFNNCVGCIDGLLIWTEILMESELEFVNFSQSGYYIQLHRLTIYFWNDVSYVVLLFDVIDSFYPFHSLCCLFQCCYSS